MRVTNYSVSGLPEKKKKKKQEFKSVKLCIQNCVAICWLKLSHNKQSRWGVGWLVGWNEVCQRQFSWNGWYISDWIRKKIPAKIWPFFWRVSAFFSFRNYLQSRQFKNIRYSSLFFFHLSRPSPFRFSSGWNFGFLGRVKNASEMVHVKKRTFSGGMFLPIQSNIYKKDFAR